MVSFGHATTRTAALLLILAPSASAFAPPKTSTSANVAGSSSSSPPKAISIPVEEPATTTVGAPWDRIGKDQDAITTGGRDDWIRNLDYEAFAKDVTALGKELQKSSGPDDVEHLNKVSYIVLFSITSSNYIRLQCKRKE